MTVLGIDELQVERVRVAKSGKRTRHDCFGAFAQCDFPARPVTIVTAFAPGSGPDAVLRLVAEKLGKAWNQRVLIENKPGGGGFIAIDAVKRAAADGHTLLQLDSEHLAALPHLYKSRGFRTLETFEPSACCSARPSWSPSRPTRSGRAWPTSLRRRRPRRGA